MEATLKGYFPKPHTLVIDTNSGFDADGVVETLNSGLASIADGEVIVLNEDKHGATTLAHVISEDQASQKTWRVERPSEHVPPTREDEARHRAQFLVDQGVACVYEDRLDVAQAMLATAKIVLVESGIGMTENTAIELMIGQAMLLEKLGCKAEAMPICEQALALAREILDDKHYNKAVCYANLGECQLDRGHRVKALVNLTKAEALIEAMEQTPQTEQMLAYLQPLIDQAKVPRKRRA